MLNNNIENKLSIGIFWGCFLSVIGYFVFLQFLTPTLYEYDPYYHVFISKLIKEQGLHFNFHWAHFTTFTEFYSDKELLLHLITVPFLYFTDSIITAGKYAVIFLNIAFFAAYGWILRKYLPAFLAGLFLLLPLLSGTFTVYSVYLRPATLSNIVFILFVYALIRKEWFYSGFLTITYALSHVSFPIVLPVVVLCEVIRYFSEKEFCFRNVYAVLLGLMIGMIVHPNYPYNLLSTYLNAILVPLYNLTNVPLDFGRELFAAGTNQAFSSNFSIFLVLVVIICMALHSKGAKVSFATKVWWMTTCIFLFLAMHGNRYWYQVNILMALFFASYVNDYRGEKAWRDILLPIRIIICIFLGAILIFFKSTRKGLRDDLKSYIYIANHYEAMGRWMKYHIPAGERIYHGYWSDSPFFICTNPKNDYIMLLDPMYTFYRYPDEYALYLKLKQGMVDNPHRVLLDIFKTRYGYTSRQTWLAQVIYSYPELFKILHQDYIGFIFEVLDKPAMSREEAETLLRFRQKAALKKDKKKDEPNKGKKEDKNKSQAKKKKK